MLAHEQFKSMARLIQINEVMAFFDALGLVSNRRGQDHFGGFEYCGPDIDKQTRLNLHCKYKKEFDLPDCYVKLQRLDISNIHLPRVEKYPKNLRGRHGFRLEWDDKRIELERVRSIANSHRVCKCGTTYNAQVKSFNGKIHRQSVLTGNHKKHRCYKCPGCLSSRCEACTNCLNPRNKQACIKRKCLFPVMPKCPCFD